MIYEIDPSVVPPPFYEDNLCMERGLLNPNSFRPSFRRFPWFPFENFSFSNTHIKIILSRWNDIGGIYWESMPCRGDSRTILQIKSPDAMDTLKVREMFEYGEGILWSESGMILINSFTDYVILSLSENIALETFGFTARIMFENSENSFTDRDLASPINVFMQALKATWIAP